MRADAIRDWLDCRNATTDQVRRQFFASETVETGRKKANRWLCRQRKRKRNGVRLRGSVLVNGTGRPELVYGQSSKPEELDHEILLTEIELLIGRFERRVRIGKAIADGLLSRGGKRFAIEADNHTMANKQMNEKWCRYAAAGWGTGDDERYILIVCRSKGRLRRLIRGCPLKNAALFSLVRWLSYRNVRYPWIDSQGNRAVV